MHIQADRALIPALTPSVRYLTVTITAPGRNGPAKDRPAVNVGLVLDRSGSMNGRKIEMARQAVSQAIQLLNAKDYLSLVVYDDHVDTLLESSCASGEAKKNALTSLARTEARGSTDLAGGWFEGSRQVAAGANSLKRVLLLTDGLANHGIVDHGELASAAKRFRAEGITTSTFGVGADFDEELLSRLATEGGGHFYFIESAKQIPDFLASEVGETLEIVARDVVLDLTCSTGVHATVLTGYQVETSPGRVRVKLGDLVADQEIRFVIAAAIAEQPVESIAFVDCRVTDREGVIVSEPMRMEWRAADAAANDRQPVNENVLVAAAEAMVEHARLAALAANRRRDYEAARRVIAEAIEQVRSLAPGNRRIAQIIRSIEHEEGQLGQVMDAVMLKAQHFASYSRHKSRDSRGGAQRSRP